MESAPTADERLRAENEQLRAEIERLRNPASQASRWLPRGTQGARRPAKAQAACSCRRPRHASARRRRKRQSASDHLDHRALVGTGAQKDDTGGWLIMEGLRLMGQSAQLFLVFGQPLETVSLAVC